MLVGVFGLAASSFAAAPDTLLVDRFDKTKPAIPQVKGFNEKLKEAIPNYITLKPTKEVQTNDTAPQKVTLAALMEERKKAVITAIRQTPDRVEEVALDASLVSKLPEDLKSNVEQKVTKEGKWLSGHLEKSSANSTEIAALELADKSKLRLIGKSLPKVASLRPSKVTGVHLGGYVAVKNVGDVQVVPLLSKRPASIMQLASTTTTLASASSAGLKVRYFSGISLTKEISSGIESNINHYWSSGSPKGVPSDNFSAQWTGSITVPKQGDWYLQTSSDDGVRVWLDEVLVIDNWTDHPVTNNLSKKIVVPNDKTTYRIKVEYYERNWNAVMQLRWNGPEGSGVKNQIVPTSAFSYDDNVEKPEYTTCDLYDSGPGSCGYAEDENLLEDTGYPATDNNKSNKVLIVPVKLKGSEVPRNSDTGRDFSPDDLKNIFNRDVSKYYTINSYGTLNMKADAVDWQEIDVPAGCDNRTEAEIESELSNRINNKQDPYHIDATGYQYAQYYIADYYCGNDNAAAYAYTGENYPGRVNEAFYYLDTMTSAVSDPLGLAIDSISENYVAAVTIHETGHMMGLKHAHAGCENALKSACTNEEAEYGNPYSPMGHNRTFLSNKTVKGTHFTTYEKFKLGWLRATSFDEVTTSRTVTISASNATFGQYKGIRIPIDSSYVSGESGYLGDALFVEFPPPTDGNDTGVVVNEVGGIERQYLLNGRHDEEWNYHKAALQEGQTYRYRGFNETDTDDDVCIQVDELSEATATITVGIKCKVFDKAPVVGSFGITDKDGNYIGDKSIPVGSDGTTSKEPTYLYYVRDVCNIRNNFYLSDSNRILRYDLADTRYIAPKDAAYSPVYTRADRVLGASNPNKWTKVSTDGLYRTADSFWSELVAKGFKQGIDKSKGYILPHASIACDPDRNLLFVPQSFYTAKGIGGKIDIYNVADTKNGQLPTYVIGQDKIQYNPSLPTPTSSGYISDIKWRDYTSAQLFATPPSVVGDKSIGGSTQIEYSPRQKYLYALDLSMNRIFIYDTSNMVNGLPAKYVIGQPNFATSSPSRILTTNSTKLCGIPDSTAIASFAVDDKNNRLFVTTYYHIDGSAPSESKIHIFDTTKLSNCAAPVYTLKTTLKSYLVPIYYDSKHDRLISEISGVVDLIDVKPKNIGSDKVEATFTTKLDSSSPARGSAVAYTSDAGLLWKTRIQLDTSKNVYSTFAYRIPDVTNMSSVFRSR